MFGQKLTRQGFYNAMQKTKSHLGNAYHQTKNFLGHVDNGYKVAKKIYSILEPTITSLTGNNTIHNGVMKAVSGYDEFKHKVIHKHDEIENHVRGVSNKFKKAGLSIGLD